MGWDLGPSRSLSTEQLEKKIAEITNSISPQKADVGKTSKAKKVFGDVLSGIQVFGGFVAQGAAIVRSFTLNQTISELTTIDRFSVHHSKSSTL